MRHGLDTCFLVAHEVREHPQYANSRALFRRSVSNGDDFALAPQVLAELVHVLTDQRRFDPPMTMDMRLREPSLQALLRELAAFNPGLCVITTRLPVTDIADQEGSSALRRDLDWPFRADLNTSASATLRNDDATYGRSLT
jgi:predicted nucleic acid-binding protein